MKLLENANDHLEALLKVANATDSNAETKAFDSAIEYLHSVANI
jgi:hypothetical protein